MRSAIGIVFYRTSNAGPCLWRAGSVRSNRWSRIRRNPFVRSDTLENQIAPTKTCPYLAPLFLDLLCAVHVVLIHVCTCVAASGLRGGGITRTPRAVEQSRRLALHAPWESAGNASAAGQAQLRLGKPLCIALGGLKT